MKVPVIETLAGSVNGVNLIFQTSVPYLTGSVKIFRNGLMNLNSLVDGWIELGGKRLMFKEAPITGDVLQVYYIPA